MSSSVFLIGFDSGGWFAASDDGAVRRVAVGPDESPESCAADLVEALGVMGYRGQAVCLGLPSELGLAADIDVAGLPRNADATAQFYRLEEQLPIDAESLTADFFEPVAGRRLGVAVATDRVAAIVEAMTELDVPIASICPTALLALLGGESIDCDYVLIGLDEHVDVVRLAGRAPMAWYTVGADADQLAQCIRADLLSRPVDDPLARACVIGDVPADIYRELETEGSLRIETTDGDALALAARGAATIMQGRPDWVDLRRGDLAPRNPWSRLTRLVRTAALLAAALLVMLSGIFLWQGSQLAASEADSRQRIKGLYQELHPGKGSPRGGVSRSLAAERRQLTALSGSADVPLTASALDTLRALIANLPPEMRVRITELRIGPANVFLYGQTLTFTDAETVAQHLADGGFSVDPPRSERTDGQGVSFTLTATVPAELAEASP